MDILFISQFFPDPNGTGAQRRAWVEVSALAVLGPVKVIIITPPLSAKDKNRMLFPVQTIVHDSIALTLEPPYSTGSNSLTSIFYAALFKNNSRRRKITRTSIDELKANNWSECFAIAFCFRLASYSAWNQLQHLLGFSAKKAIVDFDDIESRALMRALKYETREVGYVKSLQELINIAFIRLLENEVLRRADCALICSDVDRQFLESRTGKTAHIDILPNTIDTDALSALPTIGEGDAHELLFLGSMNYAPNIDGAEYLVQDILPIIKRHSDKPVRLSIVGFNPPEKVLRLQRADDIEVTGGVDNILPYYQAASIVLVPLRFGGGTRIKILEAMAYGRPVVSTHLGAEGLDVKHGQNILLADTAEDFATCTGRLLKDRTLRESLVAEGRRLVLEKYSHRILPDFISQLINA